jgi:hypothetical protein
MQVFTSIMSRSNQFDGPSILTRYTSVVAAIASSSMPLKGAVNDQVRDDRAKVESAEDGRSEATDRVAID